MMTNDCTSETPASTGTELVRYVVQVEPLRLILDVRHNPSYLAQLIASAADRTAVPQRRGTDSIGPIAAYAVTGAVLAKRGLTRRIV